MKTSETLCPVCDRNIHTDMIVACWHDILDSKYRVRYGTLSYNGVFKTRIYSDRWGVLLEIDGLVILNQERIEKLLLLK